MKVLRIRDSGGAPALVVDEAALPTAGRGEVLIRVYAAGVTATELEWWPTSHTRSGARRTGAIPGHEFSGVVQATGPDVADIEAGRAVFGMNDWFADGAMAEYCVAGTGMVARKPSRLSHAEAASAPMGALTAWQGLIDRAKIRSGERVLVHGGAGAVGVFAVQFAHMEGAAVIATASAANAEFVKVLGAGEVVDYRAVRFEEHVAPVDVVFDTVGGETPARSWSVLKPGGRVVTIAAGEENATDARTKEAFFIMEPDGKQLGRIGDLLQEGRLRTVVDAVVTLARAADAFAGKVERRHRGKVVVAIAEAGSATI